MAIKSLVDRVAKEPIVLCLRSSVYDGKEVFAEYPTRAYVREFSVNDEGKFGTISNGTIFLLPSESEKPLLPGIIKYDGREFEIDGIRILKDMKCRIVGYEVACGSGAKNWRHRDIKPKF